MFTTWNLVSSTRSREEYGRDDDLAHREVSFSFQKLRSNKVHSNEWLKLLYNGFLKEYFCGMGVNAGYEQVRATSVLNGNHCEIWIEAELTNDTAAQHNQRHEMVELITSKNYATQMS